MVRKNELDQMKNFKRYGFNEHIQPTFVGILNEV